MAAQYNPQTLAKTIFYITYHAPAEYGLFWDPDGTMPWKELYWALQEDPSLRFVRESHIRELTYLGLELPFVLDGNLLRLMPNLAQPSYPLADHPPERLYFACRRKHYSILLEHGITASHRPYVPMCADRELALRIGKRRDPEPLLVEVLAAGASAEGEAILWAGAGLYLVESVSVRHLIFPLIRAEQHAALTSRKKAETKPSRSNHPVSAGSFLLDAHQLHGHSPAMNVGDKAGKKKGKKKDGWKRESKKERHKRSL
jgi:putative RNA 2'-phosphotransferase